MQIKLMLLLIRKLCWKESQPKFHAPIKWGTKLAIKRKKREEEECKKKNEIDSQKSPKLLSAVHRHPEDRGGS